jgi:hypothetical protein
MARPCANAQWACGEQRGIVREWRAGGNVLLMPGKAFEDSLARKPTGAVFEWSPGTDAFVLVKGSELPGNNGIETSADGSEDFVVSSGFQTVVAFSHSNPAR